MPKINHHRFPFFMAAVLRFYHIAIIHFTLNHGIDMKKLPLILLCLIAVLLPARGSEVRDEPTRSEFPRFEFGAILGFPTGINAKYWINNRLAVDVAGAWAFEDEGSFEVHSDLLYNLFYLNMNSGLMPVYFGLGGAVYFTDDTFVGVRIPIGITYLFDEAPLSLLMEVVPIIGIAPSTALRMGGGIGVRFTIPMRRNRA
ncbi:MAG: hypothetical protein LBI42_00130 [Chitinispirillales bacterium]|jgi:hypothetical protein|nr:hypothetical protein [Chitinispirillales bacterium]